MGSWEEDVKSLDFSFPDQTKFLRRRQSALVRLSKNNEKIIGISKNL